MTVVPRLSIRPGPASTGLLALPWERPLAEWDATEVALRDVPVGPSRHLVRFVEIADRLYALKEMPPRVARQEYDVLRELQRRRLPAVAPVGMVEQPHGEAVLITEYLEGSWQYRRLFLRLPPDLVRHRERLLDAMAMLLVELHRNGIFWGDCSLANTLFKRDGQVLQAYLVDAETSRVHPVLSDGQRAYDLDILVENVTGGLMESPPGSSKTSTSTSIIGPPRRWPSATAACGRSCTASRPSAFPTGCRWPRTSAGSTTWGTPSTR